MAISLDELERQALAGELSIRQIVDLIETTRAAFALLGRITKYAQEDRARTPGVTRLARALDEAERMLADRREDEP